MQATRLKCSERSFALARRAGSPYLTRSRAAAFHEQRAPRAPPSPLASAVSALTHRRRRRSATDGEHMRKYVITDPKLVTELAHHNFTRSPATRSRTPCTWTGTSSRRPTPGWTSCGCGTRIRLTSWAPLAPVRRDRAAVGSTAGPHLRRERDRVVHGRGRGRRAFLIDKTCAIYVPRGLVHGPMNFPRMVRPVLNIAIGLGCGDYQ